MNVIEPSLIVQNKNDFNYSEYRRKLEMFSLEKKPYHELIPRIEEMIIAAEKIYLWGMSFSSLSDIYKTLTLLNARESAPVTHVLISHKASVGELWIEPTHSQNGIHRRQNIISNTIHDFKELSADIRTYNVEDVPVSNGFIIDNSFLFIRFYNFVSNSATEQIFPLELIPPSAHNRVNYFSQDQQFIEQFLHDSYKHVFDGSHRPNDIRTFFNDI